MQKGEVRGRFVGSAEAKIVDDGKKFLKELETFIDTKELTIYTESNYLDYKPNLERTTKCIHCGRILWISDKWLCM